MDWCYSTAYFTPEEMESRRKEEESKFYTALGRELLQQFVNNESVTLTITHETKDLVKLLADYMGVPPDIKPIVSRYCVKAEKVRMLEQVRQYMPSADFYFGSGRQESIPAKLKNCLEYMKDKDGEKFKTEWREKR